MLESDPNKIVPWYIMAMYAENEGDPILSAGQFDRIRRRLIDSWEEVEHELKDYITLDDVVDRKFRGEYPQSVILAKKQIRYAYFGKKSR